MTKYSLSCSGLISLYPCTYSWVNSPGWQLLSVMLADTFDTGRNQHQRAAGSQSEVWGCFAEATYFHAGSPLVHLYTRLGRIDLVDHQIWHHGRWDLMTGWEMVQCSADWLVQIFDLYKKKTEVFNSKSENKNIYSSVKPHLLIFAFSCPRCVKSST